MVILLGSHIGELQFSCWAVILESLRISLSAASKNKNCPERLEKDGNVSKLWEENDFWSQSSLVQKSYPADFPT